MSGKIPRFLSPETLMQAKQLRQQFLNYFEERDHTIVPSSTLVPPMDPSLLFTNSGMVQFKDIFLGQKTAPYTRACSCQRSLRVGGKHNDLEVVGHTHRHLTLFEMLGNFSFGDYFKPEAIELAWTFVTKVLQLNKDRLWVTVHQEDDSSVELWRKIANLDDNRILRIDGPDNFWQMGNTGPCGYCTEIFYDMGEGFEGSLPGTADQDGDRYTELWNLVFMEFNLQADGSREPLAQKSVDTGMGLERLECMMQGVAGVFQTKSYLELKNHLADTLAIADKARAGDEKVDIALNVMSDHIRSSTLMLYDGVFPSNEGRGYILRRVIRRAIRYGYLLGRNEPFLYQSVDPVVDHFAEGCVGLQAGARAIAEAIRTEEERFYRTLEKGMSAIHDRLAQSDDRQLSGEFCFKLYDCYGFPLDLTQQMASEHQFSVDVQGFGVLMQEQRENARACSVFGAKQAQEVCFETATEFVGYDELAVDARIVALVHDGAKVESLEPGVEGIVVLDKTPFYAESGGQVGDIGVIFSPSYQFVVCDTKKLGSAYGHIGRSDGAKLQVGDSVRAEIDGQRREKIVRNHSATHLLHQALVDVLGDHVRQCGSLVDERRTRFDFSHDQALSEAQIEQIEQQVNQQILSNAKTQAEFLVREQAIESGAKALFGEKYDDTVRVLKIGNTRELCGGTHVGRTGDIGLFKVIGQSGVGSGIRRVEATTGTNVLDRLRSLEDIARGVAGELGQAPWANLPTQVRDLRQSQSALLAEKKRLNETLFQQEIEGIAGHGRQMGGYDVFVAETSSQDADTLRTGVDRLKSKYPKSVVVLASPEGQKVKLFVGVGKQADPAVSAKVLIRQLSPLIGGKGGGGRDDFAQAGGTRADLLPELPNKALSMIAAFLQA